MIKLHDVVKTSLPETLYSAFFETFEIEAEKLGLTQHVILHEMRKNPRYAQQMTEYASYSVRPNQSSAQVSSGSPYIMPSLSFRQVMRMAQLKEGDIGYNAQFHYQLRTYVHPIFEYDRNSVIDVIWEHVPEVFTGLIKASCSSEYSNISGALQGIERKSFPQHEQASKCKRATVFFNNAEIILKALMG
jgi:hypothetical protein